MIAGVDQRGEGKVGHGGVAASRFGLPAERAKKPAGWQTRTAMRIDPVYV